MASGKKQNSFKERVLEVIDQILPPSDVEIDEIKEEIWGDLTRRRPSGRSCARYATR